MSLPIIALRSIQPQDMPVLRKIYASTRADELALLGWTAEQQQVFLRQQFDAQHHHYQTSYTNARFQLVLADDQPIGRLYVARWPNEIRLIDITLLPEYRNAGIGSRLLHDLLDEALASGRPVRIHVEKFNPALRLYQRFGFVGIEDRGIHWFMEWAPALEVGRNSILR